MTGFENLASLPVRRLARVFALIAIAVAAGHLIQTLADRKSQAVARAAQIMPSDIVPLSAAADEGPVVLFVRRIAPDDFFHAGNTMDRMGEVVPLCADHLSLQPLPGAMIGIALTTGCRASERVVLRHAGLAVTVQIGPEGRLQAQLPALAVSEPVEEVYKSVA